MPRKGPTLVFAIIAIVILLYNFSGSDGTTNFRKTTEGALNMKDHYAKMGKEYLSDAAMLTNTNQELEDILRKQQQDGLAAENVAEVQNTMPEAGSLKIQADKQYEEVSIAGRKKMPKYKEDTLAEQPKYPSNPNLAEDEEKAFNGPNVETASEPGREAARAELQRILKRSPRE